MDIEALGWLETVELPRPCSIFVELDTEGFQPESDRLAALCD